MYNYVCVCVYTCVHMCISACALVCMCVFMSVCVHVCIFASVCVYVCLYVYVVTCTVRGGSFILVGPHLCVLMCVCVYVYVSTWGRLRTLNPRVPVVGGGGDCFLLCNLSLSLSLSLRASLPHGKLSLYVLIGKKLLSLSLSPQRQQFVNLLYKANITIPRSATIIYVILITNVILIRASHFQPVFQFRLFKSLSSFFLHSLALDV